MDKVTQVKTQFRLEQWKKLISECQNSGLPVRTWCTQNGFKEQSYYYYLKKLREQAIEKTPKQVDGQLSLFNEVELEADTSVPEPIKKTVKGYVRTNSRTKREDHSTAFISITAIGNPPNIAVP